MMGNEEGIGILIQRARDGQYSKINDRFFYYRMKIHVILAVIWFLLQARRLIFSGFGIWLSLGKTMYPAASLVSAYASLNSPVIVPYN